MQYDTRTPATDFIRLDVEGAERLLLMDTSSHCERRATQGKLLQLSVCRPTKNEQLKAGVDAWDDTLDAFLGTGCPTGRRMEVPVKAAGLGIVSREDLQRSLVRVEGGSSSWSGANGMYILQHGERL